MVKVKNDLIGQKFGYLTVIQQDEDYIGKDQRHRAKWKCECDCGKITSVLGESLKSGNTISCGCINKANIQSVGSRNKKYNTYDLSGEYGIGWTLNTDEPFYFDKEDFEKIYNYCWTECHPKPRYRRLVAYDPLTNKHITMHQIIYGKYADHINRNTFDNRKCNLRSATIGQNNLNSNVRCDNRYGVTGIDYLTKLQKWRARIKIYGKEYYLGLFDNIDDAVRARYKAESNLFGDFAPQHDNKESI